MIIIDIGNTFIKILNDNNKRVIKYSIKNEIDLFFKFLNKNEKNKRIVLGCTNNNIKKIVKDFLVKNNFSNYYFLSYLDFKNKIKLNKNINIKEVGIDILSMIYFIDNQNYILLSSGTAIVICHVSDKLDGAIIGSNLLYNLDTLKKQANLKNKFKIYDNFATDTNNSINSFLSIFFINPFNELIKKKNINLVYLNNLESKYFKHIKGVKFYETENMTILGYKKLLKTIMI